MPTVGPQLPPHLVQKRKRDDAADDDSSSTSSSVSTDDGPNLAGATKQRRVVGPSLPPAPIDQMPVTKPRASSNSTSSDDEDDDYGPRLPSTESWTKSISPNVVREGAEGQSTSGKTTSRRDDWMIVPPSHGDWSSKVDPTKLKNRKFNTGKGGRPVAASSGVDSSAWHETPAEKQARLQKEMMGVKDNAPGRKADVDKNKDERSDATRSRLLKDYAEQSRGPSLYEVHQRGNPQDKEDDPSARAFDREKDIAGGVKINSMQRREMLSKAADFKSKFSSAKYL